MNNPNLSTMFYNYYRVLIDNYDRSMRKIVIYSTEKYFECN